MKTMKIKAPKNFDTGDQREWSASYTVYSGTDARLIRIESRSTIDIVVAKISRDFFGSPDYYISAPTFGVAIPEISSLYDTFWIAEKLHHLGMPAPDAVTAAQVIADMGNF